MDIEIDLGNCIVHIYKESFRPMHSYIYILLWIATMFGLLASMDEMI